MFRCEVPRRKRTRGNCENTLVAGGDHHQRLPPTKDKAQQERTTERLISEAAHQRYYSRRRMPFRIFTESTQQPEPPATMHLPTQSSANELDDRYTTTLKPMLTRESQLHRARLKSEPVFENAGRMSEACRKLLIGESNQDAASRRYASRHSRRILDLQSPEINSSLSLLTRSVLRQLPRQISLPKAKVVSVAYSTHFDPATKGRLKPSSTASTRSNFVNSVPPGPAADVDRSPIKLVSISDLNKQIDFRMHRLLKTFKETLQ